MNRYLGIYRRCELHYIREELDKYGMLSLEGRLLPLIKDKCMSQEELGYMMNLDKGRIARAVSLLEEKGLVCRQVNEKNRRQKLLSLSEAGVEMLKNIEEIYRKWDNICYTGFTEEEKTLYQDFIKRMAENAAEYRRKNGGCLNG